MQARLPVDLIDHAIDIDWHVHSTSSVDSRMEPSRACHVAKNAGLKGICFAEHIDFDPRDAGFNFFNWPSYLASIDDARARYPGLAVKSGFELNWQREFSDKIMAFMSGKHVDLVLGSVHWVSSGHLCEKPTFQGLSFQAFMDEWIEESIDLLERDICHGFAHFDYFCWRGLEFCKEFRREDVFDRTRQVVDLLIKKGVSLEVNTSAFRKGFNEPFPSWDFVEKYFKEGGRHVHLGSDSHDYGHVGLEFERVARKLRETRDRYAR